MAGNNAFPPLDTQMGAANRGGASPTASAVGSSLNGNGAGPAANYMAPLPVGHQQDLNFLYAQIQELGSILRSNREKVNVITRTAEEVAVSTCASLLNVLMLMIRRNAPMALSQRAMAARKVKVSS